MAERFIRVQDLNPQHSKGQRLSVVSNLCPAAEAIPDGFAAFLPDAVAPRGEWRAPTPGELSSLLSDSKPDGDTDIQVVALPGLANVLGHHLGCREDLVLLQKAVRDVKFVKALENCIDELIPFCTRPEGLAFQGACVSPGGMRMITRNMDLVPPLRIGFHVDNWDDLPLPARAGSRRRLCVNLGLGPRYLLFLRTPLSSLVAAGKLPAKIPQNVSPACLIRAYLRSHLEQFAVRICIDPGEAYVVNAEDVIHDGASDPGGMPDVALHFLGYFGPDDSSP